MEPDPKEEIMKLVDQLSEDMTTSEYRELISELIDEMNTRWEALETDAYFSAGSG